MRWLVCILKTKSDFNFASVVLRTRGRLHAALTAIMRGRFCSLAEAALRRERTMFILYYFCFSIGVGAISSFWLPFGAKGVSDILWFSVLDSKLSGTEVVWSDSASLPFVSSSFLYFRRLFFAALSARFFLKPPTIEDRLWSPFCRSSIFCARSSRACLRFCSRERVAWDLTTIPVGICLSCTAELVLFCL